MRIIYPTKVAQILVIVVCSYVLVRNRQVCYEKLGFDISEGVEHVLSTLEPKSCENYLISTTEFFTLLGGNEPAEKEKHSVETSKPLLDEKTTIVASEHVTAKVHKVENVTVAAEETKQKVTKTVEVVDSHEKKLADNGNETKIHKEHKLEVETVAETTETPKTEVAEPGVEKKAYLFERPDTFRYELYGNRSTKAVKGCVELTRQDMVSQRDGVTWDILSCSSAVLVLLAAILLAETAYAFFTGNEFSQTGSRVIASVHLVFDLAVALLLLIFRMDWDARSAFSFGETMQYPCGWKCVELIAWLLAILHLAEAFFYRVVNGCIVFEGRMNSYNVAQREMDSIYTRTSHDEPLDRPYEW